MERITLKVEHSQHRFSVTDSEVHVTSSIPTKNMGPRVRQLGILEWVVRLFEIREDSRNMFLIEGPVGATNSNKLWLRRLRSAPFVVEEISHLRILGIKDPRSGRPLKR